MSVQKPRIARRELVKVAGAASLALAAPAVLRGADDRPKIKLGIIGMGGRGRFVGDLFAQNGNYEIVALHDVFRDRVDLAVEKLKVPNARTFVGLDGYKKLLDSGVDAVAIESPPYFHPEQAMAAVDAGKHVYLAKPVAVDVPGALKVEDAGKKAQGRLNFLVDFQTRADEFYQGAAKAVHEGMIGEPVIGQAFYYCGRLNRQVDTSNTPMARLRNWVFDIALSGDIIVEQNIHVLDVANWLLKSHPLKAVGSGGRKARTDVGDCWDHFSLVFHYPNNVIIDFSSGQFCTGFDDLCVRLCGSRGTVETHYGGIVVVRAKEGGYKGGKTGSIYKSGAATNIKNFADAIRSGKFINSAADGVQSTLTSILGRTAAYSGKAVTWDQMMSACEKLDAKLTLPPGAEDWKG